MENQVNAFLQNYHLNYPYDEENKSVISCKGIDISDFALFKVNEITYEEDAPRKEAVENFLSTMRIRGFNLVFLIVGEKNKTSFYYGIAKDLSYYGIAKDLSYPQKNSVTATDVGEKLLKPSIIGNFRGSKVTLLDKNAKNDISKKIEQLGKVCIIDGVPGVNEDKENFQGIDRFVDTMQGDEYVLIITAKWLTYDKIEKIEQNVNKFYAGVSPVSKLSIQQGKNDSNTKIESKTLGKNDSTSTASGTSSSESHGESENTTEGESITHTKGRSHSETNYDDTKGKSSSTTEGKNTSSQSGTNSNFTSGKSETKTLTKGTNESINTGTNITEGTSETVSREHLNKNALEWLKYLDDVLYKRIDYGKGKGLCITSLSVCAKELLFVKKAQNTLTALFSGNTGNKVPLRNNINLNAEEHL